MAHAQLHLINIDDIPEDMWRLDPQTINVGRKGLAQARAALQDSLRAQLARAEAKDDHDHDHLGENDISEAAININRASHDESLFDVPPSAGAREPAAPGQTAAA